MYYPEEVGCIYKLIDDWCGAGAGPEVKAMQ